MGLIPMMSLIMILMTVYTSSSSKKKPEIKSNLYNLQSSHSPGIDSVTRESGWRLYVGMRAPHPVVKGYGPRQSGSRFDSRWVSQSTESASKKGLKIIKITKKQKIKKKKKIKKKRIGCKTIQTGDGRGSPVFPRGCELC